MVQPPFEIFLVPTWLRVPIWSGTDFYKVGLTGRIPHRLRIFQKRKEKDPSRNQGCQNVGFEPATLGPVVQRSNHSTIQLLLPNRRKIFAIYAPTLLMYIVTSLTLILGEGVNYLTPMSAVLR